MGLSWKTIIRYLTVAVFSLSTSVAAAPNLIGQIVTNPSYKSIAIFKKGERVYTKRIGEKVGEYWIERIEYRYVHLIDINGKTHTLRVGEQPQDQPKVEPHIEGIERFGDQILMTDTLRDHISSENLLTVMMQAASEPYYSWVMGDGISSGDWALVGFRLFEIEPGSIYEIAGIKNGDVITHIDGVPLNSAYTAISMLREVREYDSFTYQYLRNGIPNQTSVNIVY